MAGMGQPARVLRELTPGARALLIAELERTMLRGEDMAGAELILAELRRSMHEGRSTSQRIGHHARLFFNPIEPFVVDDVADHKHCGRIARSALEPIWLWLSNTVMPGEAKTFAKQVEEALLAGDTETPISKASAASRSPRCCGTFTTHCAGCAPSWICRATRPGQNSSPRSAPIFRSCFPARST